MSGVPELRRALQLMILTDPSPACGRPLADVVSECVEAGATAIQLRDKAADARTLAEMARQLLPRTRPYGVPLIVNDRLDVALAVGADGVHLGPDDLPVSAARGLAPSGFIIGASTDDPCRADFLAREGADYLGVGAVYGSSSKPGLAHEAIGLRRVREVGAAAGIPVVGIGGITPGRARAIHDAGAGIAVLSAVMAATSPGQATSALLEAMA